MLTTGEHSRPIGILYELPDGRIARTTGWSGRTSLVTYHFDDGKPSRLVPDHEFQTWKPRGDLSDFPDARDPRLPYVFDLHWDIKHASELRDALANGHEGRRDLVEQVNLLSNEERLRFGIEGEAPLDPIRPRLSSQ